MVRVAQPGPSGQPLLALARLPVRHDEHLVRARPPTPLGGVPEDVTRAEFSDMKRGARSFIGGEDGHVSPPTPAMSTYHTLTATRTGVAPASDDEHEQAKITPLRHEANLPVSLGARNRSAS